MKTKSRQANGARSSTSTARSSLARHVRKLRGDAGLTLQQLSVLSKVSTATLSKIENEQLQPTYDTILKLAEGLGVNISSLFHEASAENTTRLSVTQAGCGIHHEAERYVYEMLNTDLATKKMTPLKAIIKTGHAVESHHLIEHGGEECVLVLSGAIKIHTEHYAVRLLNQGDCAYFDSTMRHALEAVGDSDAEVFWICSSEDSVRRLLKDVATQSPMTSREGITIR